MQAELADHRNHHLRAIDSLRIKDLKTVGFLIVGPAVIVICLQSLVIDIKLYSEIWDYTWVLARLGIIPASGIAMGVLRSKYCEAFGDLACVSIGLYVSIMLAYFATQTGFTHSEYLDAFALVLFGGSIVPIKPKYFFLNSLFVLAAVIAVGTLGYKQGQDISKQAFVLEVFFLMAGLTYFIVRRARIQGYDAKVQLQNEIEHRDKEIKRLVSNEVLLEQERIKIEVGRQVAHDIRSPVSALNSISNSSDLNTPAVRELLHATICRINNIARDILNDSYLSIEPAGVTGADLPSLKSVCKNLIEQKQLEFGMDNNSLRLNTDFPDFTLTYDRSLFERILSNLINNAFEALPNKGGFIEVSISKADKTFSVVVRDNGRGIPQSDLAKIGKKGFSTKESSSSPARGLGLFHAKSVAFDWKGSIDIQSNEGLGSIITLTLPIR